MGLVHRRAAEDDHIGAVFRYACFSCLEQSRKEFVLLASKQLIKIRLDIHRPDRHTGRAKTSLDHIAPVCVLPLPRKGEDRELLAEYQREVVTRLTRTNDGNRKSRFQRGYAGITRRIDAYRVE